MSDLPEKPADRCLYGHNLTRPDALTNWDACRACHNHRQRVKRSGATPLPMIYARPKTTHCIYGHSRAEVGVIKANGACRECNRIRAKAHYWQKVAARQAAETS